MSCKVLVRAVHSILRTLKKVRGFFSPLFRGSPERVHDKGLWLNDRLQASPRFASRIPAACLARGICFSLSRSDGQVLSGGRWSFRCLSELNMPVTLLHESRALVYASYALPYCPHPSRKEGFVIQNTSIPTPVTVNIQMLALSRIPGACIALSPGGARWSSLSQNSTPSTQRPHQVAVLHRANKLAACGRRPNARCKMNGSFDRCRAPD